MRTIYEKFPLSDVMGYFIEGFKPTNPGEKMVGGKWYIDQHQQIVIFELTVDEESQLLPEDPPLKFSER